MKSWNHSASTLILRTIAIASPFVTWAIAPSVLAQATNPSILPAPDGTGTQIIPNGNRLDIGGGQLSGDRANLFHSFTRFGLTETQIANFLSNPEIRTIFARIAGGEPSIINGMLQVSGGNTNLFLMNPAGIVFGQTASLNVPAAFTATTANGIGFGDRWWSAVGSNNYTELNGLPNQIAFTMAQPGAIVNAGNLAVPSGQTLGLLGGTVVNTGQLSAPGGSVVVTAVPGSRVVHLSQPGSLLSFRFEAPAAEASQPAPIAIPSTSLPQLLTGGGLTSATGVAINANGQVELVSSGQTLSSSPGSASIAGSIRVDGTTGGQIQVVGDRVGLYNATLSATGTANGGTVIVGGDYQGKGAIPNASRTYVNPGSTINVDSLVSGNGGRAIVWADETTVFRGSISGRGGVNGGDGGFAEVSGKQNLGFTGKVDVGAAQGNPGTLLLDPQDIIIVNGAGGANDNQVLTDSQVLSGDSPNAIFTISETVLEGLTGNIILEVTRNITIQDLADDTLDLGDAQSISFIADSDGNGDGSFVMHPTDSIITFGKNIIISGASIRTGRNINTRAPGVSAGSVSLLATGDVTTGSIESFANFPSNVNAGNITIISKQGKIDTSAGVLAAGAAAGNGGNIFLDAFQDLTTAGLRSYVVDGTGGKAGDITLKSRTGTVDTSRFWNNPATGKPEGGFFSGSLGDSAGAVQLDAGVDIVLGLVFSDSFNGAGSNLILKAGRNIITGDIDASGKSVSGLGNGGTLDFQAGGFITTGAINVRGESTAGVGNAGSVTFDAQGGIAVQSIDSTSNVGIGRGGNVTLSAGGNINIAANIATFSEKGDGGNVNLQATGDITLGSSGGGAGGQTSVSIESFANNATGGQSGDITLISKQGGIDTSAGNLNASPGKPGNITLIAKKDIKTTDLRTEGESPNAASAGKITVISEEGSIDTSFTSPGNAGRIATNAAGGSGGKITLQAPRGNITTGAIESQGTSIGGAVEVSSGGDITIKNPIKIGSSVGSSGGGALTLSAPNTIKLPETILTNGADIISNVPLNSLVSSGVGSSIDTDGGSLTLSFASDVVLSSNISIRTNGGAIKFTSSRNLTISGDLNSSSDTGNGGNVDVAVSGDLITGSISTASRTGQGGDILLRSDNGGIKSQNLTTTGRTGGGSITVIARTQITTDNVDSSATVGNGGSVFIDPLGDVQVGFINAQGGSAGIGGNVDITTQQFFRATNVFSDRNGINASISASGGAGGGTIIIRHDGGDRNTPFIVGNASINGTAGAITTNNNAILPTQSFPGIYWQFGSSGDIGIITSERNLLPKLTEEPKNLPEPLEDDLVYNLEELFTREYEAYFQQTPNCNIKGLREVQATLQDIADKTNLKPGAIYVFFDTLGLQDRVIGRRRDGACDRPPVRTKPSNGDVLGLFLVPPKGKPVFRRVNHATYEKVIQAAKELREEILTSDRRGTYTYRKPAQQFYEWLVDTLKIDIQARGINNLVFVMDQGLRTLPLAALYDGQQHLIETYSVGLMPSFTKTTTAYSSLQTAKVLAGGISKFSTSDHVPLDAVKVELEVIDLQWPTQILRDEEVTPANLKRQRSQYPYEIIHLATHAKFIQGPPDKSVIVLKDEQQKEWNLTLEDIRNMGWNNPPTELLVLSACQTALGDKADLGFAGIANQSGVKSVLASIWKVEDAGVPPLMAEFYYRLSRVKTKAEALRLAQLALLHEKVFVQDQHLIWSGGKSPIPGDIQVSSDLWHPSYWAGFTIVGSPW
jgi:filamentous hemagglutinin family protein